jgi:hypothetical protein
MTEAKMTQAESRDNQHTLYFKRLMPSTELYDTLELYKLKKELLETGQPEFEFENYSMDESERPTVDENEQSTLPPHSVDQQNVVSQQGTSGFRRCGKLSEY